METRETDTSRAMTGTPVVHDNYTLRPVGVWDLTWIALGAAALVGAQQTPTNGQAYCTNSTFTWADNSMGQDPCSVAELLPDSCGQTPFVFPIGTASPNVTYYVGPSVSSANSYTCNSVCYSLLSACAACQSGAYISWSEFAQNCSQTYVAEYPGTIPSSTTVPKWAYLNVVDTLNFFNVTVAYNNATAPASTTSSTSISTSASTSTSTSTPTSLSKNSGAHVNIGGIVGSVVGGVIGGLLFIGLLYWLYRKGKAQRAAQVSPQTRERERQRHDDNPSSPTSPYVPGQLSERLFKNITGTSWSQARQHHSG